MVYLGLGTNLGDRKRNLEKAIQKLNASEISVLRQSSCYETEPRDVTDQPWFLNMVVECKTRLLPMQLMQKLLKIEREMGRDRTSAAQHRGPRLIDLDMLLYRKALINTAELTVPHPRMLERRFVLEPLLELVPALRDPRTGQELSKVLPALRSQTLSRFTT